MSTSIRLSSTQIEFEYKREQFMTTSLTITNVTNQLIAYKFKATNPNVFLVKPAIGVLSSFQKQQITLTLHYKVFENTSVSNFKEKLQLLHTAILPQQDLDAERLFQDKSRNFENLRIGIVILDSNKSVLAQTQSNGSNALFNSVHKGSTFSNQLKTYSTFTSQQEARSSGQYYTTNQEDLNQEYNLKQTELSQIQNEIADLKSSIPKKQGTSIYVFIMIFLITFVCGLFYKNGIHNLIYQQ